MRYVFVKIFGLETIFGLKTTFVAQMIWGEKYPAGPRASCSLFNIIFDHSESKF